METITTVIGVLNNPLVHLGGSAVIGAILVLFAYLIKTQPKARDVAQDLADLEAEVEPWVEQAEKLLLPGELKYSGVLQKAEAWLAQQGITGRRGRLVQKYLPALIELSVKRMKQRQAQGDRKAS